jgi:hypothetical protein
MVDKDVHEPLGHGSPHPFGVIFKKELRNCLKRMPFKTISEGSDHRNPPPGRTHYKGTL